MFKFKITKIQIIISILIAAGFILRIKDLGAQSLWLDEAISSIAAVAFLKDGVPVLPSGVLYDRALLNTFLIALSFKFFGINEFAARLPSVLFGTLIIALVYLIGSKWENKRIGIVAAFLVAFSVMEIAWSRQARMYQQLQFFYLLSLYLFYEFTRNKNPKGLALLAFSLLGTVMSHEFGYVLIPVFLIYLVLSALKERSSVRTFGLKTTALAVLIFGALIGLAYFKDIIPSVLRTEINYYYTYIRLFKENLGIFLFLAVPGGTVLVNRDWKKGLLLITALITPLYFIFFHVSLLGTRYIYFVIPILFILTGYFLDFVVEYLRTGFTGDVLELFAYTNKIKINLIRQADFVQHGISGAAAPNIIMALLLIFAMYLSPAFTFAPKEKYELGVNAPLSNFRDAYMYVGNSMAPGDAIVSAWTPPAQFYLGKSDYWLAFNVIGTGAEKFLVENSSREIYTNATSINDVEAFKIVVSEHGRGWVIVDGVAWYKLRPSVKDFIVNNLTFYMKTDRGDAVRVYGWER